MCGGGGLRSAAAVYPPPTKDVPMRRLHCRDDRGASSVEYGLVVAAVAAAVVAILMAFGTMAVDLFDNSCDAIGSKVVAQEC